MMVLLDISYVFELVDTRKGRELIFQNYSYTRFCNSSTYNCSSKKTKFCHAQVVLDDDKVLIISNDHNHLPPFLLRDENGTLLASYMMRAESKYKKKGKATVGPLASRNEVDSLVASIMNSVKQMENKMDIAETGTSVIPELKTTTSVFRDKPPEQIETRAAVSVNTKVNYKDNKNEFLSSMSNSTKTKTEEENKHESSDLIDRKYEPLQKMTCSLKTSPAKEFPALREVDIDSKNHERKAPPEEQPGPSQINPAVGQSVPREVGSTSVLLSKLGTGCLVPNHMFIILPNSESIHSNNKFALPSQNVSGFIYNNRIPSVKTEPDTTSTSNNETGQLKNNDTCAVTSNTLNTNTVIPNKVILLLHNKISKAKPSTNESSSLVPSNTETVKPNETGSVITNKMFILMHNKNKNDSLMTPKAPKAQKVQHAIISDHRNGNSAQEKETKSENNVFVQTQNIRKKKVELKTSIPMSSIKNIILPIKSDACNVLNKKTKTDVVFNNVDKTTMKTEAGHVVSENNKYMTDNVVSNKTQPKETMKIETVSVVASNINVSQPNTPKVVNVESKMEQPLLPIKTETGGALSRKTNTTVTSKIQTISPKKFETIKAIQPITPKKSQTGNVLCNKMLQSTIQKADSKDASDMPSNISPPVKNTQINENRSKITDTISFESSKTQPIIPNKIIKTSSMASSSPKKLAVDLIKSKNIQIDPPKINNLNVQSSNDTKQPADDDDEVIFSDANNPFEVPISVSMIPLPKGNDSSSSDRNTMLTEATNEPCLVSVEVPPVMMIERLPMKHKSGSFNMLNVPPKKRHYQV